MMAARNKKEGERKLQEPSLRTRETESMVIFLRIPNRPFCQAPLFGTGRASWLSTRACHHPVAGLLAAAVIFSSANSLEPPETLSNIPQTLSGDDGKAARIQKPKSRRAESCTVKCVTTCIRGGAGSPGEGPLNARRPLVVFKQGFRSRQYCLIECSDICNLIKDGEDGS